jgi:signal transduction histidine kinase
MLLRVNSLARWLGFAWVGVLTFAIYPARGRLALDVQAAGYALAALAMAGWLILDHDQRAAPYRVRALPVLLGVIATATAFAAASGGAGGFLVIFGLVAVMVAGSEATLPAALAVTAAGILASEVGGLAFDSGYSMIGFPIGMASCLLIGRNRAAYRVQAQQSAMLLAQHEQLQAEQRRADLLDERARIAREIHDVLAHSLGALSIQVQAARSVLTDRGDITAATELLAAAQRMVAEGLVETRRAVSALRTGSLPLEEELATATATYADRYRVAVKMDTSGTPRPVPPDATVALLRVAQEALVNAAKHAVGQPVTVSLAFGPADLRLTVRNDTVGNGTGANSGAGMQAGTGLSTADTGYGLTSMRERVRLLSGTLDAGLADGQWTVTAWLPLAQPAGPDEPGSAVPS